MADQRGENSVLFSLKELRRLEEERVEGERAAVRAREEAERRAREDAERRAREEQERLVREEHDRVRRAEEERMRLEREERLRVEEAERRARVEGEMRLQEERMRLELQARKQAKSPVGPIIGVAVVLLAVGGGVVWKLKQDAEAEKAAERTRIAQQAEEERRKLEREAAERERKFQQQLAQMQEELAKTTDAAKRAALQAQINAAAAAARGKNPSRGGGSDTAKPSQPTPRDVGKRNVDDDPLGGLR